MSYIVCLTCLILLTANLFAEGGFDNGTSAGKGNMDISITINPLNYFDQGQSYIMMGYGLTNNFDIHGYYSTSKEKVDNYYLGLFYQFFAIILCIKLSPYLEKLLYITW